MLRLNVYCSLIPSSSHVKFVSSYGSSSIQYHRARRLRQGISAKALKDEKDGETSGFRGRNWDPGLEIEVPFEQRPVRIHFISTYLLQEMESIVVRATGLQMAPVSRDVNRQKSCIITFSITYHFDILSLARTYISKYDSG